jgi:hypothetical protein
MMINNFVQENINMGIHVRIRLLINVNSKNSSNSLHEYFDFNIILKHFPMLDIVRYARSILYFYIISELGWHRNSEISC